MNAQHDSGAGAIATEDQQPTRLQIGAIGIVLLLFFVLFTYLLMALWPMKISPSAIPSATAVPSPPGSASTAPRPPTATPPTVPTPVGRNAGEWDPNATVFGRQVTFANDDVRLLLILVITAALGSFVQVATSFSTFLGNKQFLRQWIWWYVLRAPIGIALALLFYFAVRGGFFTSVSGADVNPFGIAALGGLVGMFSKQASDKLQDVFTSLFNSNLDAARADKLTAGSITPQTKTGGEPVIVSSDPPALTPASTSLTLHGSGFAQGAIVSLNGNAKNTAFLDAQTLAITLDSADLQAVKALNLVVTNPDGAPSTPFAVRVDTP